MLKKWSLILLISIAYQSGVHALPFGSFDPRSLAMGGTGVTDQTKMPIIQGVSEIAEVVGGTRNVQLLIGSRSINTMSKMI